MASFSISGIVTVEDTAFPYPLPSGLRVELNLDNGDPPENWIGTASIATANGHFTIGTATDMAGAVVNYRLYRGSETLQQGTETLSQDSALMLLMSQQVYDMLTDSGRYLRVSGRITLGPTPIDAVPVANNVFVSLNKALFRNNEELTRVQPDSYGRYCLKIPLSQVAQTGNDSCEAAVLSRVFVALVIEDNIVERTPYITLEDCKTPVDLHTEAETYYYAFHTEFEYTAAQITAITGLTEANFHTITTSGPDSELNVILGAAPYNHEHIRTLILAAKPATDLSITYEHLYALMRSEGDSMPLIASLSPEAITEIINGSETGLIIPPGSGDIPPTIDLLETLNAKNVSTSINEDGESLYSQLSSLELSDEEVQTFLKLNLQKDNDSIPAFWAEVENVFGATRRLQIQEGLQTLSFTGQQPEMTNTITVQKGEMPLSDVVLTMNQAAWHSLVVNVCASAGKLCIPRSIRGDITDINNDAVKQAYAQQLYGLSRDLFATQVINQQLQTDPDFADHFQDAPAMVSFLQSRPDYDFRADNVWNDESLQTATTLREDLLPVQNLSRLLNGKPDVVTAFIKAGIRSSSDIAAMPAAQFATQFTAVLDSASPTTEPLTAHAVYQQALRKDLIFKSVYAQLFPGNYIEQVTKSWSPEIWSTEAPDDPSAPDLQTLFGNMDFCTCSDCTSMFSPAAYFTDLLNFIKTRIGNSAAYTELLRRRPDLVHIDLSCKNTNTTLPYIDLINELLELIILRDIANNEEPTLFVPQSFQTSGTTAELEAFPEHTYKDINGDYQDYPDYMKVYDLRLSKAIYPIRLPFNMALTETRTYFEHMGYSRYALMEHYRPVDYLDLPEPTADISAYNLLAEWLGLSRLEADIITFTPHLPEFDPATPWKLYGFDSAGTWYETLCEDLPTLLKRSDLSYKELLQLLVTDFLNAPAGDPAERPFAIVAKPGHPADTCHIDELMLASRLPPEQQPQAKITFFENLHRFLRLQRASGWSIYQLDILLSAFDASDIAVANFKLLARAHRLADRLGMPAEMLSAFWSPLNTTVYINFHQDNQPPLATAYAQVYANKGVINPADPAFDDPANLSGSYTANAGTILAATNLRDEELSLLLDYLNINAGTTITLPVLSRIYALGQLCRHTGLTVIELLTICHLNEIDGSLAGAPADQLARLEDLLRAINALPDPAFSLEETDYLIAHRDSYPPAFQPEDKVIQPYFENLRSELQQRQEAAVDPAGLELLLKDTVKQSFAEYFEIGKAFAERLLDEDLFIEPGLSLLDALISTDFLESENEITRDASVTSFPFSALYDAYTRVDKIGMIVNRLQLSSDVAALLQSLHTALGTLDFAELPVQPYDNSRALLLAFQALCDWVKLRDQLSLDAGEFISLLYLSAVTQPDASVPQKTDWIAEVARLTRWSDADIRNLVGDNTGNGLLHVTYSATPANNDFGQPYLLQQLLGIMEANRKTGLSPVLTHNALLSSLSLADARVVRKAAKAKYANAAWLKIAKPLQDELRKQQRDALLAYVLARPELLPGNNMAWRNENDVFAYLLIDVEMDPCMQTSRIRQGLSSLQLYLDRIILNIERVNGTGPLISMPAGLAAQWQTWRKWYRVWEANRKVFLYPENWIEPELRDNKTPFFKDLETRLLQDEVTDKLAESAYKMYLERLEEVARLEPVSMYHETSSGKDTLHVFGRTDVHPQRYFYRRREANEWLPWERIDVDIKSDHVVPVMWNNRLFLFWLDFKSKPLAAETIAQSRQAAQYSPHGLWLEEVEGILRSGNTGGQGAVPDTEYVQWEILLNWTEMQDGKWQRSDLSRDKMQLDISKPQISGLAENSYSNASRARKILNVLTKNRELSAGELFKNRLYLFTPLENPNITAKGITFNLLFPSGLDENGNGLHTFIWSGDVSRDPYVLRDGERGHQMIAPAGTRFNKMKLEEMPLTEDDVDIKLVLDSYTTVRDGYYTYAGNYYIDRSPVNPNLPGIPRDTRSDSRVVLNKTPYPRFRLTARAATKNMHGMNPMEERFFFEDEQHTFYVQDEYGSSPVRVQPKATDYRVIATRDNISIAAMQAYTTHHYPTFETGPQQVAVPTIQKSAVSKALNPVNYRFYTFYHAQVPQLISALNNNGVPALLHPVNQRQNDSLQFLTNYQPTQLVNSVYPRNNTQFDYTDAYGVYNWELFFHIPMLVAQSLSNNRQFRDAQRWYHYIFDPTSITDAYGGNTSPNQRFWKFYPFYNEAGGNLQSLNQLLLDIQNQVSTAVNQVRQWENDPFNPHLIARMRILAYMKNVLMKYLDNLIAWGDQLFSQDTIESVNEATQLYVLAANLLGDRPQEIPPRVKKAIYTFEELLAQGPLDALSNAMVAIESFYDPNAAPWAIQGNYEGKEDRESMELFTLYFCLPPNAKLLGYWDTIADRLFKIRHCLNLEGVARQLPLFEPPIDPALLVRARALGVSIDTVVGNLSGLSLPAYRFTYTLQKAHELAAELKGLGGALLSALEKQDAEGLALLRSGHELQMLDRVRSIREQQVREAESALEALRLNRENTELRYNYYSTRPFKNASEQAHLSRMQSAMELQLAQGILETTAGIMAVAPTIHAQLAASGFSFGGLQLANVMRAASTAIGIKVALDNMRGSMAATIGGYERRRDDWNFQASSAAKELEQLDEQLLGAEIRLDIAQQELNNHELQIENARDTDDYMRRKYTNEELYRWMSSQLSTVYFSSYQLAYEMARRAEQCFIRELPDVALPTTGFIRPGYWDSLRKGLLSGEQLQYDLRNMESGYMEANKRELELTKHISLAITDPEKLLELKATGFCNITLDKVWFDLDYPGHYLRKIKSVSISIPAVTGPYTTLSAQLTLKHSAIRDAAGNIITGTINDTPELIATSSGQRDSGVFELNFRDERYIPFENRGAEDSEWTLNMMPSAGLRQFDYDTITDVILHVSYTARYSAVKETATISNLESLFDQANLDLPCYFSVKHNFSNAWFAGFSEAVEVPGFGDVGRQLELNLKRSLFPEYAKGKAISISLADFMVRSDTNASYKLVYDSTTIDLDGSLNLSLNFTETEAEKAFVFTLYKEIGGTSTLIEEDELTDLYCILTYRLG